MPGEGPQRRGDWGVGDLLEKRLGATSLKKSREGPPEKVIPGVESLKKIGEVAEKRHKNVETPLVEMTGVKLEGRTSGVSFDTGMDPRSER